MVSKVSIRQWEDYKEIKKLSSKNKKRKIEKPRKTEKKTQYSNSRFLKIKEEVEKEKKMKAFQIYRRLERVKSFLGVFSCDNLPTVISSPSFFVVNTDGENLPGSHWIGVRVSHLNIEIYDSLRLKTYPKPLQDLFQSKPVKKIPLVQSKDSFLCGLYACFFILYRNIHPFKQLCSSFSKNLDQNDFTLYLLLNELW